MCDCVWRLCVAFVCGVLAFFFGGIVISSGVLTEVISTNKTT